MGNNIEINPETMEWVKSICIALVIGLLINSFLFRTTQVKGDSMNPTLEEKDRMISIKASLYFTNPSRGDVIVFKIPNAQNRAYIKRVIGVEGDKITIFGGNVYLNDELLVEDYIEEGVYTDTENENFWTVPKDELFVLGDNRHVGASYDSRSFGTIPVDSVKGITNFRYFPFGKKFGNINKTP